MQVRTLPQQRAHVKVEKREDGKRYVNGYAAIYYREGDEGSEYQLWDDLYERILPGAFDDAVKEDDVRALLNHDPNQLLARTGNDLKLTADGNGLFYEFPIDENDPDHLRLAAKLERGDLTGSSFGFAVRERRFVEYEEFDVVELVKVKLYDVSPATFPAYEGTSVGIRSKEGVEELRKEYDSWKKSREVADSNLLNRLQKAKAGIL